MEIPTATSPKTITAIGGHAFSHVEYSPSFLQHLHIQQGQQNIIMYPMNINNERTKKNPGGAAFIPIAVTKAVASLSFEYFFKALSGLMLFNIYYDLMDFACPSGLVAEIKFPFESS